MSSARTEAIARVREHDLRSTVDGFQILQQRWRRLTHAQLRRRSRRLANHAGVVYQLADRVERGAALTRKHGVRRLVAM